MRYVFPVCFGFILCQWDPFVWGSSILKGVELQQLAGSDIKSHIGLAKHIEQQSIALHYNIADDKL